MKSAAKVLKEFSNTPPPIVCSVCRQSIGWKHRLESYYDQKYTKDEHDKALELFPAYGFVVWHEEDLASHPRCFSSKKYGPTKLRKL